jgi:hypothetical protein
MSSISTSTDTPLWVRRTVLALLFAALIPGSAAGQMPDSLSLSTVLRAAAAENNPRLYAAELRTRSLETRADQIRTLPDPTVSVSYFARPIVTARGEQRSQWRIQQALPTPGTRRLQRNVARLDAEGAQAHSKTVEQSIAVHLHDTFYTLYRIQELIRLIERFQSDLDPFETVALAQYEAGTEGQPAVLKAQIERHRLNLRLEQLRADYASAANRLANLTGQPSLDPMTLAIARPEAPPVPAPSTPSDRPEVDALRADIEKADRRTDLARKERWPSFSIGLQYVDIADTGGTPTMDGSDALTISAGISVLERVEGPPMIKSEQARPNAWVFVDLSDNVDIGSFVTEAKRVVAEQVDLPAGYALTWSGQYQYMERANERLQLLIPITLALIFLLLFLHFKSATKSFLLLGLLPFCLVGATWLMLALGFNMSIAVGVGVIAVAGLAAETGVVMPVYLDEAIERYRSEGRLTSVEQLRAALEEGSVMRVRPLLMTVFTTFFGLLPLMFTTGTGAQVMQRLATPMVGGLFTAALLTLVVLPAAYMLVLRNRLDVAAASPSNGSASSVGESMSSVGASSTEPSPTT